MPLFVGFPSSRSRVATHPEVSGIHAAHSTQSARVISHLTKSVPVSKEVIVPCDKVDYGTYIAILETLHLWC